MSNEEPWYKDGLQFSCSGCGDCCTGSPGYVWVNREEIAVMAAATGNSVDDFENLYVRKIGIRKSLKELPVSYDCVFLGEDRKCELYDARPRQCKTWPFWGSNLKTKEDWDRTCEICPGSGQGTLVQLDDIERQRKTVRI